MEIEVAEEKRVDYREICERLARGEEFCADTAEGGSRPRCLRRSEGCWRKPDAALGQDKAEEAR